MKKRNFLAVVAILTVSACTIVACSKQSQTTTTTESAAKEKIETLAQRFTQPVGSDYSQVISTYKNLNQVELKEFWHDIYKSNKDKGYTDMSEEQFSQTFEKLNNETISSFGVPMNKVDANDLNKIAKTRDNIVSRPPVDPPPGACGYYYYPVNLYENNNLPSSPPFFTYTTVDYWQGDCDGVEVVYTGYWNASKSLTPLGVQTGPVYPIGKYENGNTKVLFKKSVMLMAFGSIANINNHKRMANQGIIESRH